jgi:hypothetical protein
MAKDKNLCKTPYCGNKKRDDGNKCCEKCIKRNQRINNPVAYTFNALKQNTRARNKKRDINNQIGFNLTIEEFKIFCQENGYIELKGQHSWSMTIDRIDPDDPRGYHKDNIRIVKNATNVRLMHAHKKFKGTEKIDYAKDGRFTVTDSDPSSPNFVPF